MRGAALMSDQVIVALLGLFASAEAGFFAWLVMRARRAPDVQATIAAAVDSLAAHYRDALKESHADKIALSQEVARLSDEIRGLVDHIDLLTSTMVSAGLKVPPRRPRTRSGEKPA